MPPEAPSIAAVLNARDAIAGHVRWKMVLQMAIRMREPLSPADLRAIRFPNECPIGRWILSAATADFRATPAYATLVTCHEAFHREMVRVSDLIVRSDYAGAALRLAPGGTFQQASRNIANAISAVDRILPIQLNR